MGEHEANADICWLQCMRCEARYPLSHDEFVCPCGGLLDVTQDLGLLEVSRELFEQRRHGSGVEAHSGVWRFRELALPGFAGQPVSHPEGNTHLYERPRLSAWVGVEWLRAKHEGENPTGSFKDRGMTVGITQAVRLGARAVCCASTGNTSASLAAYAAHVGIPAFVFIPAGKIALGKLSQALAYGATVLAVRGDFDAAMNLVKEHAKGLGMYLLNSINPFRIEGQKTIILESLSDLDWEVPDWIVFPAGNLGNTSAFGKALLEAYEVGLISRVPRLAAIQATGANPFYQSYCREFAERFSVQAETVATAIRIGNPVSHDKAVRAIQFTGGVVAQVTDEQILEAKAMVDSAGIGCEPASACSIAGARKLVQDGTIQPTDRVVAILTGHLLKDPDTTISYVQRTRPHGGIIEIDPDPDAISALINGDMRLRSS